MFAATARPAENKNERQTKVKIREREVIVNPCASDAGTFGTSPRPLDSTLRDVSEAKGVYTPVGRMQMVLTVER